MFIESLFLWLLYVRIHIYKLKKKEYFYRGLCNFFLFLTHSLSVYPLGTNNISLTGFSFGIWNENLQKLWNIYIFSDRTCAYPFYFPHPFLHVLFFLLVYFQCYMRCWNHLWLTEKVMSGDIINLFHLSRFLLAATNTKMVYYYEVYFSI